MMPIITPIPEEAREAGEAGPDKIPPITEPVRQGTPPMTATAIQTPDMSADRIKRPPGAGRPGRRSKAKKRRVPSRLSLKQFRRLCHSVRYLYAKRAAAFTTPASDAFTRMMIQGEIVLFQGCGNFRLHDCEITELIHHGDVDVHGTGLAMAAVGTFSAGESMLRSACQN